MKQSGLTTIDFLKIDIEGGEFTLFKENLPLNRVRYLSMEVHRNIGDVKFLIDKLKANDFDLVTTDSLFAETSDPEKIDYIYGRNKNFS